VDYTTEDSMLSGQRALLLNRGNEHLISIFGSGELQPDSVIRKFRITAADDKNYLTNHYSLDAIIAVRYRVNSYQATRQVPMKMQDWVQKLDAFLKFNEYEVLEDAGRVSHEVAASLAGKEYEKFRVTQDREYIGDFEKEVKRITSKQRRGKDRVD
jgi:hypothetical protein